ncbi:tRNA pseudouridine(38/39) synthase [Pseudocercospora fuligena]|uniref:tRNA pseudouridine(38/39) synthase n=1 Tax=Pseudocercospora fuligena TaxID=685502 RepID=A0A8H6VEY9_9PEZI|nr:tRNA pseudouridine(38/39) synthase [Pseudocercospora fuligena]
MTPDYTSWTNADLIARVTDLEQQLRSQNTSHSLPPTPSPAPPKKKPKKPSKAFDPSRYNTRLIALKFAYLGGNYNGFEHHNNNTTPLPTIEEELWKALNKTKLIFPEYKSGQREGEEVSWEGVEYSKCGRTDRGVSAFGQVVGVKVRSSRPKQKKVKVVEDSAGSDSPMPDAAEVEEKQKEWDHIRDELPYIQLLNRVLPPDIRVLAWCPDPPEDFSARFSCKERRYRYFFTNPAFVPLPGSRPKSENGRPGEGWLDVEAMEQAAKKYEGLHDFRNLCKVDPSKQIADFSRRIFHAGIHEVQSQRGIAADTSSPKLYYFEVRGSAFLWHQVRHLVAVLFLVGQGYESPSIVDELLDTQKTPAKPHYEMASDIPLVLWDCIFPSAEEIARADHADGEADQPSYTDALNWIYVGDGIGGRDPAKRSTTGIEDGKYGRNGIMDELWALWRQRKMDEVLARSLMDVVASSGHLPDVTKLTPADVAEKSVRLYDGGPVPRAVGPYTPLMQRERMETPEVVNARYAARKGLDKKVQADVDVDE